MGDLIEFTGPCNHIKGFVGEDAFDYEGAGTLARSFEDRAGKQGFGWFDYCPLCGERIDPRTVIEWTQRELVEHWGYNPEHLIPVDDFVRLLDGEAPQEPA